MSEQTLETRKEAYLKSGGGKCPACFSESIEAHGSTDVEGESAFLSVSCNYCEASWDDVYTLNGIESVEGFDPDELICKKEIEMDYGITISLNGGGASISSGLIEQFSLDDDGDNARAEGAADALDSFLLALAAEGVDMEASSMKIALKTAVDAIGNHSS